jgi:transglutaminase-like putative cysteine protease
VVFSEYRLKEGWSTVVLHLLMLVCVAWSIGAAQWVEGLGALTWVVLGGGVLGMVLAKSRFPAALGHLLAGMAGLSWGAWLTSRLLVTQVHLPGGAALLELDWRLQTWVTDMVTKGQSSVASILLFVLCLLLWLVAYTSAWAIFRWGRAWWAVILCGVAMIVNVTSAPQHQTWILLAFLLAALLLIVRTSLASYEQEWRRDRVNYGGDVVLGFLRAGLAVSVLAIGLAWIVPEAVAGNRLQEAWAKVSQPWGKVQDRWEEAFQDLNSRQAPPVVLVSRSMEFSGPVKLTDLPIMDIESPSGRYWRSHTYDAYLGWGWLNTDDDTLTLVAGSDQLLTQPVYSEREILTQTVTLRGDLGMGQALTAAGDPLVMGVPVQAVVSYMTTTVDVDSLGPSSRGAPELSGASLLYTPQGMPAGTSYTARSSLSEVTIEALRQAGSDYPAWVLTRYLQLPESLPGRVRKLAEEVTSGMATPYDRVVAVEAYLRRIAYSLEIQGPEPGQDGVDYFLFQEKRGYCTYYASSMVVLLRAAGIPARYAEGFSRDQAVRGVYHIVERDSHAWPEVFFPQYGWIEFEPTASRSLTSRSPSVSRMAQAAQAVPGRRLPQSDDLEDFLDREGQAPAAAQRVPFWRRISGWVWAALVLALLAAASAGWAIHRQRRCLAALSAAERAYYSLGRWVGSLLGMQPPEHSTPLEYAEAVSTVVPSGRRAVEQLAELYVAERFGARPGAAGDAQAAWHEARLALCRRWLELRAESAGRVWRKLIPARAEPAVAEPPVNRP